MRIITSNLNGIRSATKKGFWQWVADQAPDVLCLQEVRASAEQIPSECLELGYSCHWNLAQRPGYSGVGILTRGIQAQQELGKLGHEIFDCEGRYLELEFEKFVVVSAYFPSGTSGEARQTLKYEFLKVFDGLLERYRVSQKPVIICGDVNIAHKEIDLKNWKSNQKNSGFLPEERAWMDKLIDGMGFIDTFRVVHADAAQYTWWSSRGQARAKNVGWRIDYQLTTKNLLPAIRDARIFPTPVFSDHAPYLVDYRFE